MGQGARGTESRHRHQVRSLHPRPSVRFGSKLFALSRQPNRPRSCCAFFPQPSTLHTQPARDFCGSMNESREKLHAHRGWDLADLWRKEPSAISHQPSASDNGPVKHPGVFHETCRLRRIPDVSAPETCRLRENPRVSIHHPARFFAIFAPWRLGAP
jgi:hypothetical protein